LHSKSFKLKLFYLTLKWEVYVEQKAGKNRNKVEVVFTQNVNDDGVLKILFETFF
jgi:hypothetical protein